MEYYASMTMDKPAVINTDRETLIYLILTEKSKLPKNACNVIPFMSSFQKHRKIKWECTQAYILSYRKEGERITP